MDFVKLDRYLDSQLREGIPGFDIIVCKNGRSVHRYMNGTTDYLREKATNGNELYWIYSATKVITMTAVMRLVEEGKLDLEDPVEKYIPAFRGVTVRRQDGSITPAKNTLRLRHLMSMSGGLDYDQKEPHFLEALREKHADTAAVVDAIAKRPLLFEPGEGYKYSFCHDVMGRVVEVAAGKRFYDWLKENIFDPLGMKETYMHAGDEAVFRRLVAQFEWHDDHTSTPFRHFNNYIFSDRYDSGGAGIITSVADYGKFIGALSNNGESADGYRLLTRGFIDKLRFTTLPDDILRGAYTKFDWGYSYALGVYSLARPEVSGTKAPVGTFGWDGAAGAYVMAEPDSRIGVFMATQVLGCPYIYKVVHQKVRDLVFDALL